MNEDLKTKGAALKAACVETFDDNARSWALDYVEMSERRADRLALELEATRAELAKLRGGELVEGDGWIGFAGSPEGAAELRAKRDAELEAARSGAACRQPWHNPEGSAAERARAALQDAIHHVQRDGEQGLARLCALMAVEILETGASRHAVRPRSARELENVERRLVEIIGQLGALFDMGAGVNGPARVMREHAGEIQTAARRALAELRGEDWRNG